MTNVRNTISAVATIMNAQRNPKAACNSLKPDGTGYPAPGSGPQL